MDDVTASRPCGTWEELCLFLGASPSSFGGMLLTLAEKADPGNRARLRAEFPRHVAAWEAWRVLAPCTWGELQAAIPARAERRTVTYDLNNAIASFVLTTALEEFAARQRDQATDEGGHQARERWADLADQMRAQAEAAG